MPLNIARWFSREGSRSQRLTALGPLLLLAFLYLVPPPQGSGKSLVGLPSLCLFQNVSGLPCPGCGITRSLVCCAHGLFGQAIRFHPLGPPVFASLVGMALTGLLFAARPKFVVRLPQQQRWANGAAWVSLVLLGIIWVARLSGALPAPP